MVGSSLSLQLRTKARSTLDRTPFHMRAIHTHTHTQTGDSTDTFYLTCIPLGCKRNLEHPEENHPGMRRLCKLQKPNPELTVLLISVMSKLAGQSHEVPLPLK